MKRYVPNQYFLKPSNVLRLQVLRMGRNSPKFSIQDGTDSPWLTRFFELLERLRETAALIASQKI